MGERREEGAEGEEGGRREGAGRGSHHIDPWSISRPLSVCPAQLLGLAFVETGPCSLPLGLFLGLSGEQLSPDSAAWGHWALRSPPPGCSITLWSAQ